MTARRLVLSLAATCGLAVVATPAVAPGATCHEGIHQVGSHKANTFCGPAHATVVVNGQTKHFTTGGECTHELGSFQVNLGTIVIGQHTGGPDYLGFVVNGTQDGTYENKTLGSFVKNGKHYGLDKETVVISHHLTRVTFTGQSTADASVTLSGTIYCH